MAQNAMEAQLLAELDELREKHTVAVHTMHQNELAISRLEHILASCVLPTAMVTDHGTSSSLDFVEELGVSNDPWMQVMHLEANVRHWQAEYEELRQSHAATITQLTREGLELLGLLHDDITSPIGPQFSNQVGSAAALAQVADPHGYGGEPGVGPLPGAGQVEALPHDALMDDEEAPPGGGDDAG